MIFDIPPMMNTASSHFSNLLSNKSINLSSECWSFHSTDFFFICFLFFYFYFYFFIFLNKEPPVLQSLKVDPVMSILAESEELTPHFESYLIK